jgi:hypothetical protein
MNKTIIALTLVLCFTPALSYAAEPTITNITKHKKPSNYQEAMFKKVAIKNMEFFKGSEQLVVTIPAEQLKQKQNHTIKPISPELLKLMKESRDKSLMYTGEPGLPSFPAPYVSTSWTPIDPTKIKNVATE